MKRNKKLFIETLAQIKADPTHWRQAYWINYMPSLQERTGCGTTACMAGWATLLSGAVPLADGDTSSVIYKDGVRSVQQLAIELLGIDPAEAHHLFAGRNSKNHLMGLSAFYLKMNLADLEWLVDERATEIRAQRTAARKAWRARTKELANA